MTFDTRALLELLPAIYRLRDAQIGAGEAAAGEARAEGPLAALLGAITEQLAIVEEALAQQYDDQFVETCVPWVVPYIGDLLGVRPLHGVVPAVSSPRAEVANTIAYRRRKGTASMLEQLSRDVTGWDAHVAEMFERLGWTQYMQHVRPGRGGTLDLGDHAACESVTADAGAFDRAAHTVDVRRIAPRRGRFNIPNVGIFLWRLQAYPVERATARQMAPGCFTFSPLGLDAPLFNRPRLEPEITHLAEPVNVAAPLRRRPLHDELEGRRQALVDGREVPPATCFGAEPAFSVFLRGGAEPVPPAEILIRDLSGPAPWRLPPNRRSYRRRPQTLAETTAAPTRLPIQVAVDPQLGRIAFPAGAAPERVDVSHAYGFSGDLGGGPYDRSASLPASIVAQATWQVGVSRETPPEPGRIVATLTEAVHQWNAQPPGTVGIIALLDSQTYRESLTGRNRLTIPAGSRLTIVSAGWPAVADPSGIGQTRVVGQVTASDRRAHLRGNLSVVGTAAENEEPGRLLLNGLLLEGNLTVLAGNLGRLDLAHTTLAPGTGRLAVNPSDAAGHRNDRLAIGLTSTICGPIVLPELVPTLSIASSIVDGGGPAQPAVEAPGSELTLDGATVLGAVRAQTVELSNSIVTGRLVAARRQVGCVRFSYLPPDSLAPRRHRCQPNVQSSGHHIHPEFTSERFGDPGYGQLSLRSPDAIRRGADDESEMGAFSHLYGPQRESNLHTRLDEYLRFGLEAGAFFAT
jgi:hypothetical protein